MVAAVAGVLAGTHILAGQVRAEEGKSAESSSVTTENDSLSSEFQKHSREAGRSILGGQIRRAARKSFGATRSEADSEGYRRHPHDAAGQPRRRV